MTSGRLRKSLQSSKIVVHGSGRVKGWTRKSMTAPPIAYNASDAAQRTGRVVGMR